MAARLNRLSCFCREALPILARRLDGQRLLADVERIVATDRWVSFDRFHETAGYLAERYGATGAAVEVTSIRTGGRPGSGRWTIPEAREVHGATLDLLAPDRRRLADWRDCPWLLANWSSATPRDGLTCSLVALDNLEQLRRLTTGALNGAAVLLPTALYNVAALAADRGAAVVLSDQGLETLPEAVPWLTFGWVGPAFREGLARPVGLCLSRRQGAELRTLAAAGPVTLQVTVDLRHHPGSHDLVSGLVAGAGDPATEIWALAHCAEPGAADNAAGVAVTLAVAEALEATIAAGELPRPKRTIRLLNAYECYGFFHFLEHGTRYQRPVGGLVLDTLGLRPELSAGRLEWHETIPSSPGFVDTVGMRVAQGGLRLLNPGYRLHRRPFVSTSDTLIGDPKYGFPCPWLATWRSTHKRGYDAYHSSADTPEILSGEGLATAALIAAGYLYYLADLGTAEALELARRETADTLQQLSAEGLDHDRAGFLGDRQRTSLEGLERLLWEGDQRTVKRQLRELETSVAEAVGRRSAPRRATNLAERRVPRRTAPLTPSRQNIPGRAAEALTAAGLTEWAHYWADGRRDLAAIARAILHERGGELTLERVTSYFDTLAELEYIEWVEPADIIERERLSADLRQLGLAPGMDVMVHSSLSAIGHVAGGAETVIEALLEVLGDEGTLLMPSFTMATRQVFCPLSTPARTGAISDAFRRRPEVLRSLHPTHSVAAHGPRAEAYLADHLTHGVWAAESPLGRLVHGGGYVLSLGVGHESSTIMHVAEISLAVPCLDMFGLPCRLVDENGVAREVPGLAWRAGACPISPRRLNDTLARGGAQREGLVGRAKATLVPASEIWRARREHLRGVCDTCAVRPERAETRD